MCRWMVEAGVVDPNGPTAAGRHPHEPLPQSGDGADAVRQGSGHNRGVEALAGLQDEDRPELLGYRRVAGQRTSRRPTPPSLSDPLTGAPQPMYRPGYAWRATITGVRAD